MLQPSCFSRNGYLQYQWMAISNTIAVIHSQFISSSRQIDVKKLLHKFEYAVFGNALKLCNWKQILWNLWKRVKVPSDFFVARFPFHSDCGNTKRFHEELVFTITFWKKNSISIHKLQWDTLASLVRISRSPRIRFTDSPYTEDEPTLVVLDTGERSKISQVWIRWDWRSSLLLQGGLLFYTLHRTGMQVMEWFLCSSAEQSHPNMFPLYENSL